MAITGDTWLAWHSPAAMPRPHKICDLVIDPGGVALPGNHRGSWCTLLRPFPLCTEKGVRKVALGNGGPLPGSGGRGSIWPNLDPTHQPFQVPFQQVLGCPCPVVVCGRGEGLYFSTAPSKADLHNVAMVGACASRGKRGTLPSVSR